MEIFHFDKELTSNEIKQNNQAGIECKLLSEDTTIHLLQCWYKNYQYRMNILVNRGSGYFAIVETDKMPIKYVTWPFHLTNSNLDEDLFRVHSQL